jgi:hypothetical protein
MMTVFSPSGTSNDMPFSTLRPPKAFETFSSVITGRTGGPADRRTVPRETDHHAPEHLALRVLSA